jgi:hypothetical protein
VEFERVLEEAASRFHLLDLDAPRLDLVLDDMCPAPGGCRPGQDVCDLLEAHPASFLPVPDDR